MKDCLYVSAKSEVLLGEIENTIENAFEYVAPGFGDFSLPLEIVIIVAPLSRRMHISFHFIDASSWL